MPYTPIIVNALRSNETRTFDNKTYEYTHGYGLIINSASSVDENGNLLYMQSEFTNEDSIIKIVEPRVYFGMETNEPIITNAKNKKEFDYPLTSTESTENSYNGNAGLNLGFLDRFILGIKEKKLGIAFSGNLTKDSKIISTRKAEEEDENKRIKFGYDNIIDKENMENVEKYICPICNK